ncbi:family 1 glycosylhydrolase [Paenibacillus qinlingensis]|uniref:Beta-glucosidase/6-phospho-beta-glucosidase/beta-galactosidase n=1 Tax=Paenibacillus qinlingensis TaxID=1837343 RepID=A0ABU1NU04_9BACL|nr:family 1 glycosylhydrolase [Paenibacillus qinlingensis]MDR6550949.1 beta-glucosidase/6-phospho-beta-glucosidase/beta-galactosidase [Paenibacillus qinlingensis]
MDKKHPWVWAVGIENTFIGQTARGERVLDEFEITQHYRFWEEDLDRVRESGATMIRYGIPWYRIETSDGVFDWSWTDQVMAYFDQHRELVPIIDLMHYGTPLWLKNEFMNARYAELVARYAKAFAERYKGITKYYTPLNEPFVNAEWCGWSGTWPPYLKGLLGFSLMMNQLCKGIVLTVQSLREVMPDAVMVHVEASKKYVPADESFVEETKLWNELRFLMWELIQGRIGYGHPLYQWVLDHHISVQDLEWYERNKVDLDIVGVNYYPQFSLNIIGKEVVEHEQIPRAKLGGSQDLVDISRDLYNRYRKPIFITETSYNGSEEQRVAWLEDVIHGCNQMLDEGILLIGVTWFPFMDMVDWPYRTNGLSFKENLATFGLYSLKEMPDGTIIREKNAVGRRFEEEVKKQVAELNT